MRGGGLSSFRIFWSGRMIGAAAAAGATTCGLCGWGACTGLTSSFGGGGGGGGGWRTTFSTKVSWIGLLWMMCLVTGMLITSNPIRM